MSAKRIDSIQALRAIAALAVVALHSWQSFKIGGAGVDLFFVVSGFTMVYASQRLFGSANSILPFMGRRFTRIYPTYWAATGLFIMLAGVPELSRLITSLLLIPDSDMPIVNPGWTLIHEVSFYFLFALCLAMRMERAVAAVCLMLLALVGVGSFSQNFYIAAYSRPMILEFGLGVLAGLFYCKGVRIGRPMALAFIALALIGLGFATRMGVFETLFWARLAGGGLPALLLFVGVVFGPEIPFFKRRFLQELGDASYSIYVTHWMIFIGFLHAPNHRGATFFTSIFFGLGFYYALEKPVLAFIRSRMPAPPRSPDVASLSQRGQEAVRQDSPFKDQKAGRSLDLPVSLP